MAPEEEEEEEEEGKKKAKTFRSNTRLYFVCQMCICWCYE
jgi:hypothetical protein